MDCMWQRDQRMLFVQLWGLTARALRAQSLKTYLNTKTPFKANKSIPLESQVVSTTSFRGEIKHHDSALLLRQGFIP